MSRITSPGRATRDFVDGGLPYWASSIWPHAIVSALYFAIVWFTRPPSFDIPTENSATAAIRELVLTRQELVQDAVSRAIAAWLPAALCLLVPVFAALLGIAFRRSGARYVHHLHLALHVHAIWFAGAAATAIAHVVDPTNDVVQIVAIAYGVWYFFRALRVVYATTRRATLRRMFAIGVVYGLVSAGAVLAIALPVALANNRAH